MVGGYRPYANLREAQTAILRLSGLVMEIKNVQLTSEIVKAIKALGYSEPTLIQEQCIPEILQGRDIFGQSKTGSGKTAAFGIPILEMIQPGSGMQVLILTPTRELCVQVAEAMAS